MPSHSSHIKISWSLGEVDLFYIHQHYWMVSHTPGLKWFPLNGRASYVPSKRAHTTSPTWNQLELLKLNWALRVVLAVPQLTPKQYCVGLEGLPKN